MKRYRKFVLLILPIFVFTICLKKDVIAEEMSPNFYKYQWKDDDLVVGNKSVSKNLYIPQNMSFYDFAISLKIKQSPTLIRDLSSVSILFNNIKIHSVMMDKIDDKGVLTINVPDYLIHKGNNSITIKGFLKSTRENCEINDDINWFIVEKDSSYSFSFNRNDSKDIKDIFDDTYYSDGTKEEVCLTLPDNLINNNYSQISSISALIGFIHKDKETSMNIKTYKYSELDNVDRETILLGTVEQIKSFDKNIMDAEEWKKAEENGYIALRKIGMKNHFIVLVSNDSQIENACRILQNKSLLSQIQGENYALDTNKIMNVNGFDTNPSLDSLGYENNTHVGSGIKEFNYYFSVPAKKKLTKDNKITIDYNYSSLINYDNAYITVAVNGENLMSKNFAKDKLQDKLEFTIPEKYFEYTGFNISLKFNLNSEVERCTAKSHEDIWVTVNSIDSNLKLELADRTKYSLLNSQGLLQDSNGYVDGKITVDSYKNLSIDSICEISSYLGKLAQGVNKLFINEAENNKNLNSCIFSLTTNPIIESLNDNLRIQISDSGEFINKDLFIQNTPSLGAIELTFNGDKLVIVASDKEQLNNTIKAYSKMASSKDTVILKDGEVIDSFGKAKTLEEKTSEMMSERYNIILGVVVLLVASASIYAIYYKKIK